MVGSRNWSLVLLAAAALGGACSGRSVRTDTPSDAGADGASGNHAGVSGMEGVGSETSAGRAAGSDGSVMGEGGAGDVAGTTGIGVAGGGAESGGAGTSGAGTTGSKPEWSGACSVLILASDPPAPELLFVVDTSISLANSVMGSVETKWELTSDAIQSVLDQLSDEVRVGLLPYQLPAGELECSVGRLEVPIAPLVDEQRARLAAALRATVPDGLAPTHDAYALGVDTLRQSSGAGSKFIVLVTDGPPTLVEDCATPSTTLEGVLWEPVVLDVSAAFAERVRTFAVAGYGYEGSSGELANLGLRGGTPFLDLATETDFSGAFSGMLTAFSGGDGTCVATVPRDRSAVGVQDVEVRVYGADGTVRQMLMDDDEVCDAGWRFADDHRAIEICPPTCEAVLAEPGSSIEIEIACFAFE